MRRGFEGNFYVNTGTPAAPSWSLVDVVDDVEVVDDSEQVETTRRTGDATKARGLLSLKLAFSLESAANPPEVVAALLTAARQRDGLADFFLSDSDAAEGATGVRMLGLVVLVDSQPLGGRWLWKFEASPARPVGDWLTEGVAPLAAYVVPGEVEGVPLWLESGDGLTTETADPFILEA